jgi:hypothetical protein
VKRGMLAVATLLVVLVLWAASGLRGQRAVGPQEATVRAQLTAVAAPGPRPAR